MRVPAGEHGAPAFLVQTIQHVAMPQPIADKSNQTSKRTKAQCRKQSDDKGRRMRKKVRVKDGRVTQSSQGKQRDDDYQKHHPSDAFFVLLGPFDSVLQVTVLIGFLMPNKDLQEVDLFLAFAHGRVNFIRT